SVLASEKQLSDREKMTCSWSPLSYGHRKTRAIAKQHIVNHLVRDASVGDVRFWDAHFAISETNGFVSHPSPALSQLRLLCNLNASNHTATRLHILSCNPARGVAGEKSGHVGHLP